MSEVDGFVVPVPKKNFRVDRRIVRKAGNVGRQHGNLAA
jgi:uncharacterized protein YbaA (DUF1428 family)